TNSARQRQCRIPDWPGTISIEKENVPALTTTDETKLLAYPHPTRRAPSVLLKGAANRLPGEGSRLPLANGSRNPALIHHGSRAAESCRKIRQHLRHLPYVSDFHSRYAVCVDE